MSRRSKVSESMAVITDARSGRSEDLERRQRNYVVTMSMRTACFVGVLFAPGIFRWLCLAGAIVLPWVAVMFVNQVDKRGMSRLTPQDYTQAALPAHRADDVISSDGSISGEGSIPGAGEPSHPESPAERSR